MDIIFFHLRITHRITCILYFSYSIHNHRNTDAVDGDETDVTNATPAADLDSAAFPVVLGSNCTAIDNSIANSRVQCILCQEEEPVDNEKDTFLMTCFQQKSSVYSTTAINHDALNARTVEAVTPELKGVNMTHVSSCGHILHSECWVKYFTTLKERYRPFHRQQSIDVRLYEYWCPLCNSLCNTVIPLLPRVEEEKRFVACIYLLVEEILSFKHI